MNTTIITSIHEDIPGVKTFTLSYENGDAIAYASIPDRFLLTPPSVAKNTISPAPCSVLVEV
jgi:hypothetical protein